jgi:hypothetical protein
MLLGHGGCEMFPKQSTFVDDEECKGSWINVPYMGGARTVRYAHGPDGALTVEEFLDLAEGSRVSREWLEEWKIPACSYDPEPRAANDHNRSTTDEDDWHEAPPCLQTLTADGRKFTPGSRNQAFFNVCIYLQKRYGERWQPIARELYAARYFDPLLRADEVRDTINSVGRRKAKPYSYTCDKEPICSACDRETCLTRRHGVTDGDQTPEGWKIEFDRVREFRASPTYWFVEKGARCVHLNSRELTQQPAFIAKMKELGVFGLKPTKLFDAWIAERFGGCEVGEVPADATTPGQIRFQLVEFCGGKAKALAKDEMLDGRPWTDGGRMHFVPADFTEYLKIRRLHPKPEELLTTLLAAGLQTHSDVIKGRAVVYWSVPAPSVQTESFEVPRMPREEAF